MYWQRLRMYLFVYDHRTTSKDCIYNDEKNKKEPDIPWYTIELIVIEGIARNGNVTVVYFYTNKAYICPQIDI